MFCWSARPLPGAQPSGTHHGGRVVVDEHRIDKAGTKVSVDADIRLVAKTSPVSRSGSSSRQRSIAGRPSRGVALDVGRRPGIYRPTPAAWCRAGHAVDVGHNQLAWKLRQDARRDQPERTHIAKLEVGRLDPAPSLAVIDVSFISLRRVLPATVPHLAPGGRLYALIKPQFEVGRERIGKGGIVRDPQARDDAVAGALMTAHELGLSHLGTIESPITGTEGNVEFLAAWDWNPADAL